MSNRETYPGWILPTLFVVFVVGVLALSLGAYFFGPELVNQARASVTVVEERPEVRARLEQQYPGETITVQDRIVMNGERSLWVGLASSGDSRSDAEPAEALAYGLAKLAFDTHPSAGELSHVAVQFSTVTSAGPVRWEESSEPYGFSPEELSEGADASGGSAPADPGNAHRP